MEASPTITPDAAAAAKPWAPPAEAVPAGEVSVLVNGANVNAGLKEAVRAVELISDWLLSYQFQRS